MTKAETRHALRPIALLATLGIMLVACGTPKTGNHPPANAAGEDDGDDDE